MDYKNTKAWTIIPLLQWPWEMPTKPDKSRPCYKHRHLQLTLSVWTLLNFSGSWSSPNNRKRLLMFSTKVIPALPLKPFYPKITRAFQGFIPILGCKNTLFLWNNKQSEQIFLKSFPNFSKNENAKMRKCGNVVNKFGTTFPIVSTFSGKTQRTNARNPFH